MIENVSFIDALYDEISQRGIGVERYEELTSEARNELYDKIINPLYDKDFNLGSKSESIICSAISREGRFYFEQGVKCIIQLFKECDELDSLIHKCVGDSPGHQNTENHR